MSRLRLLLLSALLVLACAGGEEPSRVLVLGLDGLDPQTVDLLMSEGRMPSFAKLRQEGAYGRLLSQEPLLSPIIWTTIATGKTPDQHGIGHFVAVSQATGESLPVTHERQGRRDAAIADYERAVRYSPRYEPSRAALSRLTGRVDVRSPRDAAEAEAARLVEEASVAARRADYAEAMRLLDAAQTAAPAYVLIYQYRSNVAYLMGDRAAAVAALERALELEPDNALFQQNLEQLQ